MTVARFVIVLALCLSLAGCARYAWQHPYKDEGAFGQEKAQCSREALASHPVQMVREMLTAGYQTPSTTNCYPVGNTVQCQTIPGRYVPPTYINVDVNKSGREAAYKTCMEGNGWSYVQVKD
jgi:hypothetical protein